MKQPLLKFVLILTLNTLHYLFLQGRILDKAFDSSIQIVLIVLVRPCVSKKFVELMNLTLKERRRKVVARRKNKKEFRITFIYNHQFEMKW